MTKELKDRLVHFIRANMYVHEGWTGVTLCKSCRSAIGRHHNPGCLIYALLMDVINEGEDSREVEELPTTEQFFRSQY